ncbi:MAG: adenylate kinase family protein [Planctomycetia bacterium]
MPRKPVCRAFLLFGVPGSGKGTQGRALGSMPGLLHLACGDVFRQLNARGQVGREVIRYTSQGKLVPDDLTLSVWRNHVALLQKSGQFDPDKQIVILDGIPRTYTQAQLLADDLEVLGIFYLMLPDEEVAVQRIKSRALKENRLDDADERIIRDRLRTFHHDTTEVLKYYDPSLVCAIDASRRPIEILSDLSQRLCQAKF